VIDPTECLLRCGRSHRGSHRTDHRVNLPPIYIFRQAL
jgi:hypothetical protein